MYSLVCTKSMTTLHVVATKRFYYRKSDIGGLAILCTGTIKSTCSRRLGNGEYLFKSSRKNQCLQFFHNGSIQYGHESSSKVEETVKSFKEEKQKQKLDNLASEVVTPSNKAVEKKQTVWKKIKAGCLHYYHGFRLLGLDMKVSAKLIWRILQGYELSRREHRLVS